MNKLKIDSEKIKIISTAVMLLFLFGFGIGVRVNESMNAVEPTEPVEIFSETISVPENTAEVKESIPIVKPATETVKVEPPTVETRYIEPEPVETSSEVISAPDTEENDSGNGMSDLEMLACVIYQEVGGNAYCDECRYRVGDIVLNRVAHDGFPNTIYDVLVEKGQYGMFYWTGIKWADRGNNPGEKYAVERAWRIAEDILAGNHSEVYGNGYIWQAGFEQGTDGFWCCGHFFGR